MRNKDDAMDTNKLKVYLKAEEAKTLTGWDFSQLEGRMVSENLPWDYKAVILEYLKPTDRLLDMGTGGGEFLLTLNHPHNLTSVTEAYPPNVLLCCERLAPLGVKVKSVTDDRLPFEAMAFDLVINRHTSYDENEVYRVLKPGGFFITQQVGGKNNLSLSLRLIDGYRQAFPEQDLSHCTNRLKKAGFNIVVAEEACPPVRLIDLGAVVFYAKAMAWEYPDFSVDACFDNLVCLQGELEACGCIESREHRFVMISKKPSQCNAEV